MKRTACIIMLSLLAVTILAVAACATEPVQPNWRIYIRASDTNNETFGDMQIGVWSNSSDGYGVDGPTSDMNDARASFGLATWKAVVGVFDGKCWRKDLKSPRLPQDPAYTAGQALGPGNGNAVFGHYPWESHRKIWDLRVAGLGSASTLNTVLTIRLVSTLAGLPPLTLPVYGSSPVEQRPVSYGLRMVDNRGIAGAPANGTTWSVPVPATWESAAFFTLTLPTFNISLPKDEQALMNEGYKMQLYQDTECQFVKPDGDDGNDGLTWETAKRTIGAGLASASRQVWVATGIYNERIVLTSGVALYGGFNGTETDLSQRDRSANPTIIDGGDAGSVVLVPAGATPDTRIDSFTIRNGSSGGIYCSSSSPTITNNTITGNSGGGIYCDHSSPTIRNNTVTGNSTVNGGGGICCTNSSSPTITNNTITSNGAELEGGGGIYCANSSPIITNNAITGNLAPGLSGAGGICCDVSSPDICNNIVAFNSSGICRSGTGTPVLRNNCVYGNAAYEYSCLAAGTGDISADPLLAGTGRGENVHIQPGSPCRNAGWNSAPGLPATDMDGQERVQDGTVDIGADESDGADWPSATPIVVRVSTYGNDINDGASWASAKKTVQAGIEAAAASAGEAWVATGIYKERIMLSSGVALYGGFNGTETALSQRDWYANPTIIGGRGGPVVSVAAGATSDTCVDGFTVRYGDALYSGGGIYCSGSSPTIRNNTITGNYASSDWGMGGGIYCQYSSPIIINNTITGNVTYNEGGGIYCSNSSSPIIANNTIEGNHAEGWGGGIYCSESCSATIINNTITGNSAYYDGGGISCSSATITNNTITGNSASSGGGMDCSGSSATITNNTITGNSASWNGGGICCYYSSSRISNNIFAFNTSGIYQYTGGTGTPVLRNNCVYGNTAYNYSGLSAGSGDISVDPLFVDRTAGDYHLRITSPCIGSGDNRYVIAGAVDMDGEPRILPAGGTVDIGADEYSAHPMWLAGEAKGLVADGQEAYIMWRGGLVVTAKFADLGAFYVESADRASGLQCRAAALLDVGQSGIMHGTMATIDGERVLSGATPVPESLATAAVPKPIFMPGRSLGGGDYFFGGDHGQQGVWGPEAANRSGLNNMGLLVSTVGRVTFADLGFFYLDDGSALDDGSGHIGVKVLGTVPVTEGEDPVGKYVKVTGISSCFPVGADLFRLVRATDVQIVQ